MSNITKKELKDTLAQSTDKCFEMLNDIITEKNDLFNDFIILKKKYSDSKTAISLGTISFENWSILNSNIYNGILEIIDNLDETKVKEKFYDDKIQVKEIEDAIIWLRENLNGVGYIYKEEGIVENKNKVVMEFSHHYKDIEVNTDGSFKIFSEANHKSSRYRKKDNSLYDTYDIETKESDFGNFRDIELIKLSEGNIVGENGYAVYITFEAKEDKMLFHYKKVSVTKSWAEGYEKNENIEKESSNTWEFSITLDNLGLAERLKNCFEYLTIYFKTNATGF